MYKNTIRKRMNGQMVTRRDQTGEKQGLFTLLSKVTFLFNGYESGSIPPSDQFFFDSEKFGFWVTHPVTGEKITYSKGVK
ncbi:MAG: hypothetical protein NTV01_06855 [Bacteroidia bacterium]|nr:hypothetical protein [Bacteroidia bacterium]